MGTGIREYRERDKGHGNGIRENGKWISDSRQQITDEGYGIRNKG